MTRDGATTGSRGWDAMCFRWKWNGWKACSVMRDGICAPLNQGGHNGSFSLSFSLPLPPPPAPTFLRSALRERDAVDLRRSFGAPRPVRGGLQTAVSDLAVGEGNSQLGSGVAAIAPRAANDAEPNLRSPILSFDLMTAKTIASPTPAQVLTAQYDNARTGTNLNERMLTPANVNAAQFGRLFTLKVDGDVYPQPLYVSGVYLPCQRKPNLLFVATENDSVYAFDADGASRTSLWHVSLANSSDGVRPLSEQDVSCFFISPQVGITSTPVIDLKTGTLYVLARTKERKGFLTADVYKQRLHALAITTGVEKFGGPVEIKASVKGTGAGHSGGQIAFDPQTENPRAALLLSNDSVYLALCSSCDVVT